MIGGRAAGAAISRGLQNTVGRGAGRVLSCLLIGYCSEATDDAGEYSSEEPEQCPVDKNNPPDHPDFIPDKKKKGKQKIPWNKNKKGFKDKKRNYWEPVPDRHKGTHDPHWNEQHPDDSHTPIYPPK